MRRSPTLSANFFVSLGAIFVWKINSSYLPSPFVSTACVSRSCPDWTSRTCTRRISSTERRRRRVDASRVIVSLSRVRFVGFRTVTVTSEDRAADAVPRYIRGMNRATTKRFIYVSFTSEVGLYASHRDPNCGKRPFSQSGTLICREGAGTTRDGSDSRKGLPAEVDA